MNPTITDITGIGPSTAKDLAEGGISTVEDLANASSSAICAVPGFGAIRAVRVKAAAAELLRRTADAAAATVEPTESVQEEDANSEPAPTEAAAVSEDSEVGKPKKKAGKKEKKDKKSAKGKKDKGGSKKDKANKKGKSRDKKDKKKSSK